jgi:hypothetical protein
MQEKKLLQEEEKLEKESEKIIENTKNLGLLKN